ncbi:MAG TPA: hypothetical protein V6D29_01045 [Leptolyngbyaceae cyanobacterium]
MELIAMQLVPLVIVSSTVLGVGYFCLDLYRNRRRLAMKPTVSLVCYDSLPCENGDASQAVSQVSHAVGDASTCVSSGVGHCVEAIAHTLSHH